MCGLVSVITKLQCGFNREQQDVFSELLHIDMLRGPDSTGVFAVNGPGDIFLAKEASTPPTFMKNKAYDELLRKNYSTGKALIGHNRKATRGTVNDDNAHPFVVDNNIVLVHNGTMFGDHKKFADVEVDSHAIAHLIHENKGNVTAALNKLDAAYALIWFNVADNTLNFIRNTQRPLYWAETKDAWLWASEECMLDFVISRHKLKVIDGPSLLPEHLLQTFTLKTGGWSSSSEQLTITDSFRQTRYESYGSYESSSWEDWLADQKRQAAAWSENESIETSDSNFPSLTPAANEPTKPGFPDTVVNNTYHYERVMAKKTNRIVTHQQYTDSILREYPFGKKVFGIAFDYHYANNKDATTGFYLYTSSADDDDVIIRHYFSANIGEERVMNMAMNGYVFEFSINQRSWRAMDPVDEKEGLKNDTPGFTVLYTSGTAKLVFGGGMTHPDYKDKYPSKEVTH